MSTLKSGSAYGDGKPHIFYNPARQAWTCFHWGVGYVGGSSVIDAYDNWKQLAGLTV